MKKRGFSLIEVLIAIFLIGVITIAFFPSLTRGAKTMLAAKKFTEDAFEIQTNVEQEILKLNEWDEKKDSAGVPQNPISNWGTNQVKISMFGKEIELLEKKISSTPKSTEGSPELTDQYHRDIVLLLPKERMMKPSLPEIDSVTLMKLSEEKFEGEVSYKERDSGSGKTWKEEVEFCVFRWYIGDRTSDPIQNSSVLTLIREYNPARKKGDEILFDKRNQLNSSIPVIGDYMGRHYLTIAGDPVLNIMGEIPNIKRGLNIDPLNGDSFNPKSLNMETSDFANNFTNQEMQSLYNNKGLVLSAIPVSKQGLVGIEVYSNMIPLLKEKQEVLALGMEPIQNIVEGEQTVHLLLKQVLNLDKNKEYTIVVKSDDGEVVVEERHEIKDDGCLQLEYNLSTEKNYSVIVMDRSERLTGRIIFRPFDLKFVEPGGPFEKGKKASLKITLHDQDGNPVSGVPLKLTWGLIGKPIEGYKHGNTDSRGEVVIKTDPIKYQGQYEFIVTGEIGGASISTKVLKQVN